MFATAPVECEGPFKLTEVLHPLSVFQCISMQWGKHTISKYYFSHRPFGVWRGEVGLEGIMFCGNSFLTWHASVILNDDPSLPTGAIAKK